MFAEFSQKLQKVAYIDNVHPYRYFAQLLHQYKAYNLDAYLQKADCGKAARSPQSQIPEQNGFSLT